MTTVVEPNLSRADSEKLFTDPKSNTKLEFPSTADSDPSIYISLVVPAYNEQDRRKQTHITSLIVIPLLSIHVCVCYSASDDG